MEERGGELIEIRITRQTIGKVVRF